MRTLLAAAEEATHASGGVSPGLLIAIIVAFGAILVVAAIATGFIGKAGRPQGAEDDELEPIVGGIAVGKAGPPKWIFLAYVIIPALAAAYIFANASLPRPKAEEAHEPEPILTTAAPSDGAKVVKITAKAIAFKESEFELKADADAKIDFDNADSGIPHNVSIYTDETAKTAIFKGALITGPKKMTYTFKAPAAGEYYFHCDVHPNMNGTVKVA